MSDPPDPFDPDLPYKLPVAPYSHEKPDLSYAALIGQAILASPGHALRLKDIYDYISTVYPFYARNGHSHSQKWMNAIRQNLTNTPQFFKREHPSGKAAKGSLWCIADEDLPCFTNGGYNRHALNPDTAQSVKAEKRKRKREEKQKEEKSKRARLVSMPNPYTFPYGSHSHTVRPLLFGQISGPRMDADVIFPPLPPNHPNAHLVNPKTSSIESLDQDVIFPPLPAYSQTRIAQEQRMRELSKQSTPSENMEPSEPASQIGSDDETFDTASAPPMSSESSSSSVPDLILNNSSSSPRPEEVENMEDLDNLFTIGDDVLASPKQITEQSFTEAIKREEDESEVGLFIILY